MCIDRFVLVGILLLARCLVWCSYPSHPLSHFYGLNDQYRKRHSLISYMVCGVTTSADLSYCCQLILCSIADQTNGPNPPSQKASGAAKRARFLARSAGKVRPGETKGQPRGEGARGALGAKTCGKAADSAGILVRSAEYCTVC